MPGNSARRAEFEALRQDCAVFEARLVQVDLEVSVLTAKRAELAAELVQLRRKMAPLAPVSTLPDDVIVEVLRTAYLHHFPHCRHDDGLPHTNSPVAFSQVCRRWRHIALGLPTIWTCIHVTPWQSHKGAGMVRAYLARSADLPLSITIGCHTSHFNNIPAWNVSWDMFQETVWERYYSESFSPLRSQSKRWRHCALQCTYGDIPGILMELWEDLSLPQLEFFSVILWGEESNHIDDGVLNFIAPRLSHLQIDNINGFAYSRPDVFHNLTILKLSNFYHDLSDMLRIIGHLPSTMTSLTFAHVNLDGHSMSSAVAPSISLPQLQYLALIDFNETHHAPFRLASVICGAAPNLPTLHFSGGSSLAKEITNGAVRMPNVRVLDCDYCDWYASCCTGSEVIGPAIHHLSPAFPALEQLELRSYHEMETGHTPALPILASDNATDVARQAFPTLRTLKVESEASASKAEVLAFVDLLVDLQRPLRELEVSAETVHALSSDEKHTLASHGVLLSAHPENWKFPELLESGWDWSAEDDSPIYTPWNHSLDFWDQFKPHGLGLE